MSFYSPTFESEKALLSKMSLRLCIPLGLLILCGLICYRLLAIPQQQIPPVDMRFSHVSFIV